MRHADAVPQHSWSKPDRVRPLSEKGRKELEAALPRMVQAGFQPQIVVASAYERAQQTAAAVKGFYPDAPHYSHSDLGAGASNDVYKNLFLKYKSKSPILMIGHMPEVAIVSSRITFEPSLMEKNIQPGEILAFEIEDVEKLWGSGKLLWSRTLADWSGLK